jgi:hypothetical protein
MIDGFKGIVKRNLDRIRNHSQLTFKKAIVTNTGEIIELKYPQAEYKGLIFTDKISHIEMAGSLHKFANDGLHNHNDFFVKQIRDIIYLLCTEFGITACLTRLTNLEIGINILFDYDPNVILRSVIMHKGESFTFQKSLNKQYRECEHSQFYIKIYNKGLQFGLTDNVIRIEVKYRKMETLNKLGIKVLGDLMNEVKLQKLANLLLSVYEDIIMGDCTIIPKELESDDQLLYANGHNPEWWKTIKPDSKNFQGGTSNKEFRTKDKQYYRELNRFQDLLKKNGATTRKEELRKLMEDKFEQCLKLTSKSEQNCLKLTKPVTNKLSEIDRTLNKNKNLTKSGKMSEIDTLFYTDNLRQSNKRCLHTGLDISMQKESSKFLCTTGLEYYKKNHPEIWKKLFSRLSRKWHESPENIKIGEIHHSIRNEYFNKINNAKRSIENALKNPSLFNQIPYIRRDKLELGGFL